MSTPLPMTREVIVVPPELPLASAWAVMQRRRIRHLPVVRGGALIGILSDRDILLRAHIEGDAVRVPKDAVALAMTSIPISCDADDTVATVARIMIEEKIDAVPIVRGLRLIGLVTSTDLLELLLTYEEARPLPYQFNLVDEDNLAYA
jgi:acetoin utilization protein AcuB